MADDHFNPHQVRLTRFEQRLLKAGTSSVPATYAYDVTLDLGEAAVPGFRVSSLTLSAEGFGIEPFTQHAAVRMLLDAITTALAREKEGIRPGTP